MSVGLSLNLARKSLNLVSDLPHSRGWYVRRPPRDRVRRHEHRWRTGWGIEAVLDIGDQPLGGFDAEMQVMCSLLFDLTRNQTA